MRRVVVTGIGMVSPLGASVSSTWENLISGKSGVRPLGDQSEGVFDFSRWVNVKDRKKNENFIVFGIAAASQAIFDSGWEPNNDKERTRTGVVIGSPKFLTLLVIT